MVKMPKAKRGEISSKEHHSGFCMSMGVSLPSLFVGASLSHLLFLIPHSSLFPLNQTPYPSFLSPDLCSYFSLPLKKKSSLTLHNTSHPLSSTWPQDLASPPLPLHSLVCRPQKALRSSMHLSEKSCIITALSDSYPALWGSHR